MFPQRHLPNDGPLVEVDGRQLTPRRFYPRVAVGVTHLGVSRMAVWIRSVLRCVYNFHDGRQILGADKKAPGIRLERAAAPEPAPERPRSDDRTLTAGRCIEAAGAHVRHKLGYVLMRLQRDIRCFKALGC